MTDRIKGFTITLEKDIRDDDVKPLITAIQMMRGVAHVEPHIVTGGDWIIQKRTTDEVRTKLYQFIKDNL